MVKYNGKRGFQAKVIIQTIHMQESCVSQWSLNLIMLMTVYTGSKNKHFSNFPCAVKISSYFMAQIIVFLNNSSYIIATFFFFLSVDCISKTFAYSPIQRLAATFFLPKQPQLYLGKVFSKSKQM